MNDLIRHSWRSDVVKKMTPLDLWMIFHLYLQARTCSVIINEDFSGDKHLIYGVPRGSVIGPQAFTYYRPTRRVCRIIHKHGLKYHIYHTYNLYHIWPKSFWWYAACALFHLSCCVKELQTWMLNNRLKLNKKNRILCCFILPPLQFLAASYSESWWSWDSLIAFHTPLGGTQYKRPYGDVSPTWVAKSASWYLNDPL